MDRVLICRLIPHHPDGANAKERSLLQYYDRITRRWCNYYNERFYLPGPITAEEEIQKISHLYPGAYPGNEDGREIFPGYENGQPIAELALV